MPTTVVMPIHNGMGKMERAIRSVQAQTYADWELVVVDDVSTDDSHEAIKAIASKDTLIRLIYLDENSGPCVARKSP
jgi:glycosyltransferase involved in cell wall biosynthesis